MARHVQKDFYIGVALYSLLKHNRDAKPTLIEPFEDAAHFLITTNTSRDFHVYIKYTKDSRDENGRSWRVQLSDKDKQIIDGIAANKQPVCIFFVLGNDFKSCEIAVFYLCDYRSIKHKTGVSIKLQGDKPRMFDIMDGHKIAFRIERNRIEKGLYKFVQMRTNTQTQNKEKQIEDTYSKIKPTFIYKIYGKAKGKKRKTGYNLIDYMEGKEPPIID